MKNRKLLSADIKTHPVCQVSHDEQAQQVKNEQGLGTRVGIVHIMVLTVKLVSLLVSLLLSSHLPS